MWQNVKYLTLSITKLYLPLSCHISEETGKMLFYLWDVFEIGLLIIH